MACNLTDTLINIAQKSNVNQKHSAALIKNGKILNYGYNKYTSFATKSTIHAEMDALLTLIALKKKFKKHHLLNMDIIIIRISSKNHILKNSRPCNDCIDNLRKYNIRKVYYSNDFGEIVCEKIDEMKKIHFCSGTKYHKKLNFN